jgi:hypothetical protein
LLRATIEFARATAIQAADEKCMERFGAIARRRAAPLLSKTLPSAPDAFGCLESAPATLEMSSA